MKMQQRQPFRNSPFSSSELPLSTFWSLVSRRHPALARAEASPPRFSSGDSFDRWHLRDEAEKQKKNQTLPDSWIFVLKKMKSFHGRHNRDRRKQASSSAAKPDDDPAHGSNPRRRQRNAPAGRMQEGNTMTTASFFSPLPSVNCVVCKGWK
jgi:hypothetical protein